MMPVLCYAVLAHGRGFVKIEAPLLPGIQSVIKKEHNMKQNIQGVLLCLLIALPAWFLGQWFPVVGGPVFAILIGICLARPVKGCPAFEPGIRYTSKKVLQYAVVLLGFGMNLSDVLRLGSQSLPVILATITTALVIAYGMHRLLHIPGKISTLVGVGSCICGGSAIAATAPVIGADDEEIAQSISVIFLFNIAAALLFPTLGGLLGMSDSGFGLFAGTAINDTSSVTAAAQAWDGILELATIVKLTRTLAIIPITLVLSAVQMRQARPQGLQGKGTFDVKKIFPFFILFFVLASVATTLLSLPAGVTAPLKQLSKFFIVMAMAAIGLNTDLVKLVKTGGKPILMGLCCWVGIACMSLLMQTILGIW